MDILGLVKDGIITRCNHRLEIPIRIYRGLLPTLAFTTGEIGLGSNGSRISMRSSRHLVLCNVLSKVLEADGKRSDNGLIFTRTSPYNIQR